MIKKSLKLDLPAVPNNINMYGLYAASSTLVQAWELSKLTEIDFSLTKHPFAVELKNGLLSNHDIFYSQTQDHLETWLICNKGTNSYLYSPKPFASTLLIFKGEQDKQDKELITDFLSNSPIFQLFKPIDQLQTLKFNWLSYIEIYHHSMSLD